MQHTLRWKRLLMLCLALVMAGAALMAVSAARAEELSLTVSSGGEYPWTYDAENGEFYSSQILAKQNVSTLTVKAENSGTLRFSYLLNTPLDDARVSEKLTVTRTPAEGEPSTYTYEKGYTETPKDHDGIQEVELVVTAGDVLEFSYDKGGNTIFTTNYATLRFENAAVTGEEQPLSATADHGRVQLAGGEAAAELTATAPWMSEVELTALPDEGYVFLRWEQDGAVVSYESTYSFPMNGQTALEAVIVPEDISEITISQTGEAGVDDFVRQADGSYVSVSPGSTNRTLTWVFTDRYFSLDLLLTKGEANSFGGYNFGNFYLILDGVTKWNNLSTNSADLTRQVIFDLGEGAHEVELRHSGTGSTCTVSMATFEPEELPDATVTVSYDESEGTLYFQGEAVAPGSVLTVKRGVLCEGFTMLGKEGFSLDLDPERETRTVFGDLWLNGELVFSDRGTWSASDPVSKWTTDLTFTEAQNELEVEFLQQLALPQTLEVSVVDDGVSRTETIGRGGSLDLVWGAENSVVFRVPNLPGVDEPVRIKINGGSSKQLAEEEEYFIYRLDNIRSDTLVEIYLTQMGIGLSWPSDSPYHLGGNYYDVFTLTIHSVLESGAATEEELISDGSQPVEIDNEGSSYPWVFDGDHSEAGDIAFKAGTVGLDTESYTLSVLEFTVTGNGLFSFEVMINLDPGYTAVKQDILFVGVDHLVSKRFQEGMVASFSELNDSPAWQKVEIPIRGKADDEQTRIFVSYSRQSSSAYLESLYGLETVSIRRVGFFDGESAIDFGTSSEGYGSVTGKLEGSGEAVTSGTAIAKGERLILTAVVPEGATFYGWKNAEGVLVSYAAEMTVTVGDPAGYTAVIEPKGTYAAKIGDDFYETMAEALAAAEAGEIVIVADDVTITSDLTVPGGVTLLLPYSNSDRATEIGTATIAGSRVSWYTEASAAKYLFRTLTVNAGVALTVNGTLTVGAVCHYPDQSSQGHTSGAYGRLVNDGEIVIASGGNFYSYGLTEGEGRILAQSGAKVFQPFMVNNFSGGTNTQALYYANQFPFVQYAIVNIRCELTLEYGAREVGLASLYFWSAVTTQNVLVVGFEGNTDLSYGPGLILLKEGATLTRTYDGSKYVVGGTNNNADSGKTTVTISGGASAGVFSLEGFGSEEMTLALPYTFDLVLNDGNYDINYAYKIMPGASLTVGEDAVLNVNAGGSLLVYDGLRQSDMSGKRYPTTEELTEYGFSPAGALIVNGTLNVAGTFGGIVQTASSGAELVFAEGADLSPDVVDGARGGYDCNESRFTLTARALAWDGSAAVLTDLVAGKTYAVTSAEGTGTLASFTMQYLVNCTADDPDLDSDYTITNSSGNVTYHKWSTETVTVNLTLTGVFVEAHEHTWQLGEMTAEPSATEDGEALLVCSHAGCLESRTETVPAYGAPEAEYAEGLRLSDVSLPEGWSWRNPNMSLFAGETEATAVWNGMYEAQVTVTVAKASVEKPSDPQASFTYDGTLHTVQIPENPAYTVYDNTGTDAGSYTVIIRLNNTSDYQWSDGTTANLTFDWTIRKGTFDMSGVTFADAEREYTGSELSLEVSGLPEGVSVSYSYEGDRTELGQAEVTASFSFTNEALAKNYELPADMTATMTVVPAKVARPVIEGSYTYTGEPQTAQIAENSLYTVTGNTATAAGEHPVTVSLTDKTHYTWADGSTDDLTLTFTIGKATYDMSGVTFEDLTETYSGSPYTLTISGTLPEGVSVSYSANSLTNAGQLEVTASFTGDGDNYFAIPDMTATLTVSKLSHQAELEGVEDFADTEVTFDEGRTFTADSFAGMLPSLALTVTIEKDGSPVSAIHNAGVYAVTVEVADTANRTGKVSFTVTVNKAQQADFVLTASADGVSITASADNDAVLFSLDGQSWQVSGTFTGLTDGQTYTVYAKLAGDENHEDRIKTTEISTASLSAAREAIAAVVGAGTMSEQREAIMAAKAELDKLNQGELAALDVASYERVLAEFNAAREEGLSEGEQAAEVADGMTPVAGAAALGLLSLLALALRKFF